MLRLALIAAGVGAIILLASRSAGKFKIEANGYGNPVLRNGVLQLPIIVRITNPFPTSINIDRINADVYLQKSDQFEFVGKVDQGINIKPGTFDYALNAVLNLQSVFSDFFNTAANILAKKQVMVRTEVTAFYGGVRLPTQIITSPINLQIWISFAP